MQTIETIKQALNELGLPYEVNDNEPDVTHINIKVDTATDLSIIGLLYATEDGEFLRLLAYVDELDTENPTEQLTNALALNGDLPAGAFCLDPYENVLYATVNMPAESVDAAALDWYLELLLAANSLYYDEQLPDGTEGEA